MLWHLYSADKTLQLSWEEIQDGIITGTVPRDALVWTHGMSNWRPVEEVFGSSFTNLPMKKRQARETQPIPLPLLWLALIALITISVFTKLQQADFFQALTWTVRPLTAIGLQIAWLILITALNTLLAIGLWRHPARRSASGSAGLVLVLSLVALVLGISNAVSYAISAPDLYRIELARGKRQDAKIAVLGSGVVSIVGPIGPNLMRDFLKLENSQGPFATLEINSSGGLLDQAMQLARYVETRKLNVIVRHRCMSACTLIGVASLYGYADEDAVFGFHNSSSIAELSTQIMTSQAQQIQQEFFGFLRQHRVPASILEEAAKHGRGSMYLVSASDLVKHGVLRGLVSKN